MSEFHKLNISHLEKVTSNCVTIGFDIPDSLKSEFSYEAGQYVTLKSTIDGKEVRRDYSICTSPNSGKLQVAIKEVESGSFSKYANNNLSVGDSIEVSSPRGRFTFNPEINNNKSIVAFAAGSGITPIMSIILTALENEENSKVILLYGNKSPEQTIFYQDLLALKKRFSERFFIHFTFSQTRDVDSLFGRIEASTVNYIITNKYKSDNIQSYYICGPEPMIAMVTEVLNSKGITEDKIKFELFTAPQSESENQVEIPEGSTSITVMVDDEELTFVMSQKKSILEAALENDLDAPYSCQGGICSSCLAQIKEGKATMRQNNILTDNEVANGLILTCQAHPTSSVIYVDYDDI